MKMRNNRFVSPAPDSSYYVLSAYNHWPLIKGDPEGAGPALCFLEGNPDLKLREKRILRACVFTRQTWQVEMNALRMEKADLVANAEYKRDDMRGFLMGEKGFLSRVVNFVARLYAGDQLATQVDFLANETKNEDLQKIEQQQRPRRSEVNDFTCLREDHYRGKLAGASPYAKRLFNEISMSGRSLSHFPEQEIAPARHLAALPPITVQQQPNAG